MISFELLAVLSVCGVFGLKFWRAQVEKRQDLDLLEIARQSVSESPTNTLEQFYISRSRGFPAETEGAWLRLQRDALVE